MKFCNKPSIFAASILPGVCSTISTIFPGVALHHYGFIKCDSENLYFWLWASVAPFVGALLGTLAITPCLQNDDSPTYKNIKKKSIPLQTL